MKISRLGLCGLLALAVGSAYPQQSESIPYQMTEEEEASLAAIRAYAQRMRSSPAKSRALPEADSVQCEPRIEGLRTITLGPHSSLLLYSPAVGDVRLEGWVSNTSQNGETMTNLTVYLLCPLELLRQQILATDYSAGGAFLTDNQGQRIYRRIYGSVAPGQSVTTLWRARVRTWNSYYDIDDADVGALSELPADIKSKFLSDATLYQINHATVVAARDAALAGETHPLRMAQKIFAYVQAHLTYVSEGGWDPAPTVLERGTGSCSEYAYCFIAMCRSAGLPARWSGSVVRRGSESGPGPYEDQPHHRWADVYLPRIGWVECNVQGGTWGYLGNSYVITSKAGAPSNYVQDNYFWRRTNSWSGGTGTRDSHCYAYWCSNLEDLFRITPASAGPWTRAANLTVAWQPLGGTETAPLAVRFIARGQTLWQATGLPADSTCVVLPLPQIDTCGPDHYVVVERQDAPGVAGAYGPVEIRTDTDYDSLDDSWERRCFGDLSQGVAGDPDQDGAFNRCEYLSGGDPTRGTLYASDIAETTAGVGRGTLGHNVYGCGQATGKIVVNNVAWDKSLGAYAPSFVEYVVPDGAVAFRALYALEDHSTGEVVFQLFRNDALVFTSHRVRKSSSSNRTAPGAVEIAVASGDRLRLVVDPLRSNSNDHSAWLMPALVVNALVPNVSPEVVLAAEPQSGPTGMTALFTASATDPDGVLTRYGWNLEADEPPLVTHSLMAQTLVSTATRSFGQPGRYTVAFYAWDNETAFAKGVAHITVHAPTRRDLFERALRWRGANGGVYDFDASGLVDERDLLHVIETWLTAGP